MEPQPADTATDDVGGSEAATDTSVSDAGDTGATDTSVGDTGGDGATSSGPTSINAAAQASATFSSPFDAVPDATGTNVYFTANSPDGPGVFKATGGVTTKISTGAALAAPFGITISDDGVTLFVADQAAATTADKGAILTMSSGGGALTALAGTDGTEPRGVEVMGSSLYFTGIDPADGQPGVFKIPVGGGALSVVAKGAPFVDPGGVAITKTGDVYVLDTVSATDRHANVIKVAAGGAATVFVGSLSVGYPAGIALSLDDTALLVSAIDPAKGTDIVYRVKLADKTITSFTMGINTFIEPAGLHRARTADVYAWADSLANSGGTVFVLK